MKHKLVKSVVLASLAGLLAAGCDVYVRPPAASVAVSAPGAEVEVGAAPPPAPLYADVETASPGVDFVWIPGAWTWGNGRWAWERGRWDRPPHRGAVWMAHHYEYRGGRHVFVRGRWK